MKIFENKITKIFGIAVISFSAALFGSFTGNLNTLKPLVKAISSGKNYKTKSQIDELDNYSNPEWLLHLTKHELLSYLKELKDIFFYRVNINGIKRFLICPFQNGDPFYDTQLHSLQLKPYNYVLNKTIDIIKRFIMYSNDIQYNKLGSLYVLIAFTIVSMDARTALPELYYSVNYNS